ncbi:MAG: GNAT family N-acetyltransferase [Chitinophagales bacterium]
MNIDQIELTKLTLGDLEELKQISRKTFSDAFSSQNSKEDILLYLNSAFNDEKLTIELKEEQSKFYLARYKEEATGYFKINFGSAQTDINDEDAMELERIYLLHQFQGKGIGKKLLKQAINIAKKCEMKYLWLGVWEENEQAIQFYKRNGFEVFNSHTFKVGNDIQVDHLMKLIL